ncbi:MAG: asparagine synthase C-terminal domain-containing protein [Acidimicrobiales bacterium]
MDSSSLHVTDRPLAPNFFALATGGLDGPELKPTAAQGQPCAPLAMLRESLLSALQRPPCVVLFSGGVDSTLILAVATSVAREYALPLPIPFTRRFPALPETDESALQELVISRLGLDDWYRIDYATELDLIGDEAQRLLCVEGVLFPAPLYAWAPPLRFARGGSVVTGEGGDELFGPRRGGAAAYAARTLLRQPRRAPRVASYLWRELTPRVLRRQRIRSELNEATFPWLTPTASAAVIDRLVFESADEPLNRHRAIDRLFARGAIRVGMHNYEWLSAVHDVQLVQPLFDSRMVASVVAHAPRRAQVGRSRLIGAMLPGIVPDEVLYRTTKATFNRAYFTAVSRDFAASWDGSGMDESIVNVDALRTEWLSHTPSVMTFSLLQWAWLHARGVGAHG